MGRLVKLLGSGIGMASEAIHDYRARSQDGKSSPNPAAGPSSAAATYGSDAPPGYYEVVDDATAERLVRSGKAEMVADSGEKSGRSKASYAGYSDEDDSSSDDDGDSGGSRAAADEAIWELDDMAEQVAPNAYSGSDSPPAYEAASEEEMIKKEEMMIRDLVRMAGPPPRPAQRLPCPVIIPQRRPRNKGRGFVRAYAPVLNDCGIGQDVFLRFLKDWYMASKSDPWIDAIFIAATVAGFVPEVAAQVVSIVAQIAAGTAKELQSRHRRNNFLDRANQDLFMPRGLFAMVMAFKDEDPSAPGARRGGPLTRVAGTVGQSLFSSERLDINQTAVKYSTPSQAMSKLQKGLKDIRLTNGKTYGEIQLPDSAPLVYPDLDRAASRDAEQAGKGKGPENESAKEKWKGAGKWVQDYLDRKAQASYERDHRGSALAVPESSRPQFSSRFSDPDHPANSGSLVALLTGGAVGGRRGDRRGDRRAAKQERRALKREYKDTRQVARGKSPRGPREPRRQRRGGQRTGLIKKILQQDVLYLIIVNLPTDAEVQHSVADLEKIDAARLRSERDY